MGQEINKYKEDVTGERNNAVKQPLKTTDKLVPIKRSLGGISNLQHQTDFSGIQQHHPKWKGYCFLKKQVLI